MHNPETGEKDLVRLPGLVVTADSSHTVLGENTNRNLLYVAMTRGRDTNAAYLYQRNAEHEYRHRQPDGTYHKHRGDIREAADLICSILNHDQPAVTAHDFASRTRAVALPWRLNTLRRATVRASSPSRTWLSVCGARDELGFDPVAATDKVDGSVNVRQRDTGGDQCCAVDGPRGDGVDRSGKSVLKRLGARDRELLGEDRVGRHPCDRLWAGDSENVEPAGGTYRVQPILKSAHRSSGLDNQIPAVGMINVRNCRGGPVGSKTFSTQMSMRAEVDHIDSRPGCGE